MKELNCGKFRIYLSRQCAVSYKLRGNSIKFYWLGSVKYAKIMPILSINFNTSEYFQIHVFLFVGVSFPHLVLEALA